MTHPLNGLDASFLYAETPNTHMHTLKVLVFDLGERSGESLVRDIVRRIEHQLFQLPALRQVVRTPPCGLGHPVLEETEVDVRAHVTHEILWHPDRTKEDAIGELASNPLRRDRPLWELHVIEDRRAHELTLAFKIHHALADGCAASHMLARVAGASDVALGDADPAPRLSDGQLLARRLLHIPQALRRLALLLHGTALALWRIFSHDPTSAVQAARRLVTPRTSFNRPTTPRRKVALVSLSLDDVRRIKRSAGTTINDVILALMAGALRRHQVRAGEPVERPLVAATPVGIASAPHAIGNALSFMLTCLPIGIAEPQQRLSAAHEAGNEAKRVLALTGKRLLMDWSAWTPPLVLRWIWRAVRAAGRAPANLIVSNVPGPERPLSIGGATLKDLYSVGPLLETTGLNVTFWSYDGRLNGMILVSGDSDPHALADDIRAAMDELLATTVPALLAG